MGVEKRVPSIVDAPDRFIWRPQELLLLLLHFESLQSVPVCANTLRVNPADRREPQLCPHSGINLPLPWTSDPEPPSFGPGPFSPSFLGGLVSLSFFLANPNIVGIRSSAKEMVVTEGHTVLRAELSSPNTAEKSLPSLIWAVEIEASRRSGL